MHTVFVVVIVVVVLALLSVIAALLFRGAQRLRRLFVHVHDPEVVAVTTERKQFTRGDSFFGSFDPDIAHDADAVLSYPDGVTIDPADVPDAGPPGSKDGSLRPDTLHLRCKTCGHEWTEIISMWDDAYWEMT